MTPLLSSNCGTLTWVAENQTCANPAAYSGQACHEPLLQWQSCIVGQDMSNFILISSGESQSHNEQQAMQAIEALSQFDKYTKKICKFYHLIVHLLSYKAISCKVIILTMFTVQILLSLHFWPLVPVYL